MSNTTQNIGKDELASAAAEMLKELPLLAGDNNFDLSIRVRGTIRKGEDYVQSIWTAGSPEQVLFLLYASCGAVRESVAQLVAEGEDAVRTRLAAVQANPARDAQIRELKQMMRTQQERSCTGKRTVVGVTVTPLD
jgi:hypothetical protein